MTSPDHRILQLIVELGCSVSGADDAELILSGQTELQISSGAESVFEPHELVDKPERFEGQQSAYFDDEARSGSIAVVPVTGASAESGWLVVTSRQSEQLGEGSCDALDRVAALVEDWLDRSLEQSRIDQLSDTLQQNQETLQATRDRLALSNQELEQFAYIAAHELVAPLRAVAVYAEILGSVVPVVDTEQSKRGQHCAAEIQSGVALMNQQVQYLLELSRTQASASTSEPVDLRAVVDAALETLAEESSDAGAKVTVGDLPVVLARFVPLQSVFANLLLNAIRHRDASRPLEIVVSAKPVDDGWRVSVIDNGSGVDESDRVRVFGLFERASSTVEGSGIGLGLSRRIIEAFGGTIGIDPAPPGSEFWIWLPAH